MKHNRSRKPALNVAEEDSFRYPMALAPKNIPSKAFPPWNFHATAAVQLNTKRNGGGLIMFTFLLWCILFVFCWPLALLALVAYPFVWLLLLPFRIVGVAVHGVLEIIYLAITLPFRLLAAPFRV
jgi:hypothetical protein